MTAPDSIGQWVLAVRLGAPTCVVAVELVDAPLSLDAARAYIDVRYAVRLPVDMTHVDQCAWLARLIVETPELARADLMVDANGAGEAAVAMLRESTRRSPVEITLTRKRSARDGRRVSVPRRDLAASVAVLLQTGRLRVVHGLPGASGLLEALRRFDGGSATDGLVTTAALAAWRAEHRSSSSAFLDYLRERTSEYR